MKISGAALLGASVVTSSLLGVNLTTAAPAGVDVDKDSVHSAAMIAWLKENKGYFNPKLEMRRFDPSNPKSIIGMFAKEGIEEGSLMLSIPNNIILDSQEENPQIQVMVCPLVRNLANQLRLKNDSAYAPYVNYLLETQPPGQLPSAWSVEGRELLMQLLGDDGFNYEDSLGRLQRNKDLGLGNTLPPRDPIGFIEHEWHIDCDGAKDPVDEYAALLVVQRAWDDILIPVYDMMSHRNGGWLNTRSDERVHSKEPVTVHASRDIEKGEQIYTTYNMCEDCYNRISTYGTPEILRDYGFVEQYPQSWIFHDLDLGFRVDVLDNNDTEAGNTTYVLVEWINEDEPDDKGIEMLQSKLEYVVGRRKLLEERGSYPGVPQYEWDTMVEYMDAMELALNVALEWYRASEASKTCVEDGSCTVSIDRYRDLDEPYETHLEEGYTENTCDFSKMLNVFYDGTYLEIDSFKSQYQQASFLWNPKNGDTCLDLDGKIQICDAYRPHYHEYGVHYAARFLPENSIKRVLFVGGGDSMLLHEILKYPSLELVVGLELDQEVTRACFKHFGTQPHFHDERVEWWFGDAAKSLLMLPKDYFASFDMVLVDLSETVMSFKVTDELDVLEALTLLVKPDGIFVKNEVYFEKFKQMFPYSALIAWYDNPVICSQVMVMGSRTVDFMNPELTDHGTQNLVIRDLKDIDDNFDLYHDYGYNVTSFQICDNVEEKKKNRPTQVMSPGIILVVEAENVTGDLSGDALKKNLVDALKEEGFSVVSSDSVQESDNAIVYLVLKEGYVIARSIASSHYVGFDIHFWSSMHKHKDAKDALVTAVGGSRTDLSCYRVIAGGMFGVKTWKEDEKLRGPQFEEMCNEFTNAEPLVRSLGENVTKTDIAIVLEHSLDFLDDSTNLTVAVLVGNNESSKYISSQNIETIQGFKSVKKVVSLNCPSMMEFNELSEEAGKKLALCEKHLFDTFNESVKDHKFHAIVVDSTADKTTATILLKLFAARRRTLLRNVLETGAIVVASMVNNTVESYKRNLMLRFKDDVFARSPAAFAEISYENSDNHQSEFRLFVTGAGGPHTHQPFIGNLNSTLNTFNKDASHKLTGTIRVIHGGDWIYQKDFQPSQSFLPSDYNQTEPLTQWKGQNPTGHQVIVQMEPTADVKISSRLLRKALDAAIKDIGLPGLGASAVQEFKRLGAGSVLVAIWSGGSVVVLWDGRKHVDLNIYTHVEDSEIGDVVEHFFTSIIPGLATVLRDEQPRGMGRVVSYRRDLLDNLEPHWSQITWQEWALRLVRMGFASFSDTLDTVWQSFEQPRGMGRVVSYRRDLQDNLEPHWSQITGQEWALRWVRMGFASFSDTLDTVWQSFQL